jgi:hypothetical protein
MNWIEGTDMRNMIKRTLAIVGVAVLAATTYAAVPNQINYQGRLTDNTPAQAPIDATVTMGFSIWDSATGGTSLWNETQSVSVANGLFNVLLGSSTPIPSTVFTSGATRYLEISVSGETLSPRQQIAAAPFASSAASADDAGTLGGVGAAGYQQRVASPCPAGYAINSIAADGTATCVQGPQGPPGPPGPPGPGLGTGSISGTVNVCGPPTAGVVAYVPGQSFVAYTAPDGSYLLGNLPAGTYDVQIGTLGTSNSKLLSGLVVANGQTTAAGTTNVPDVANDPNNCGACGVVCSPNHANPACASGSCSAGTCQAGFANCDGNMKTNGCEVDITTTTNCGGCGVVCQGNQNMFPACVAGSCSGTCASGYGDCNNNKQLDGCETNIRTSPTNCGACGNDCAQLHFTNCNGGVCGGSCTTGWADCDNNTANGCERDVSSDPNNCGGCGTYCSPNHITRVCASSSCQAGTCDAGWGDCNNDKFLDGCEVNLNTSAANCGSCGYACGGSTPNCSGGVCVP